MEDVEYLTAEHILEVYAAIFRCSLQEANDQLRDRNALESAVVRPRSYAYYQGADLALQAAGLAHGIAETQPLGDDQRRRSGMRTAVRPRCRFATIFLTNCRESGHMAFGPIREQSIQLNACDGWFRKHLR
jgi:hypothetical protein